MVAPREGRAGPARPRRSRPSSSGSTAAGGLWSQLGGDARCRRRHRRRRHRHRHLAREQVVRRRHRTFRCRPTGAGRCVRRRAVHEADVQRQADRCPVLPRRLRAEVRRPRTTTCRRVTATATARTPRPRRRATASTASRSTAVQFEDGIASGMAPGAKVAAYKVCWEGKPGDRTRAASTPTAWPPSTTPSSTASTSSTTRSAAPPSPTRSTPSPRRSAALRTPASTSPTRRATAGPGVSTLDHPAPWVTTVAAATVRRAFQAVELGNGARYVGASTTPSAGDGEAARHFGEREARRRASDADAKLCAPARSTRRAPPARSCSATAASSTASPRASRCKRAGGVGMVMTNTSPNSLNGDYHPIPSVHVDEVAREPPSSPTSRLPVPAPRRRSCR